MTALFSSPKAPPAQVIPAPTAPMKSDAEVQSDAIATRQRLAAAGGRNSTILTATKDTPQPTAQKTLLGAG